jgi:hypothetical protein
MTAMSKVAPINISSYRTVALAFAAALSLVFIEYQLALGINFSGYYTLLFEPATPMYEHSSDGRFVGALVTWICWKAGINETHFWTRVLSMLFLALATVLLYLRVLKTRPVHTPQVLVVAFICCFLIVSNIFLVEPFVYNTIMMCLAQFLIVAAAIQLSEPILSGGRVLGALALTVAGVGTYQANVALLVPLAVILLMLSNMNVLTIVKRAFLGIAFHGVGIICSLIWIRTIHPRLWPWYPVRVTSIAWENLGGLMSVRTQYDLWVLSYNILPKGLFACFLLLGFGALLWAARSMKGSAARLLLIGLCLLAVIGLTFAPQLLLKPLWLVPRSAIPIGSLPALLLLCAFCLPFSSEPSRRHLFIAVVAGAWLVVTVISTNRILADQVHTQLEDRDVAKVFWNEILLHEKETGQTITKIGLAVDRNPTWCYPGVHCYGDMNTRCWNANYCAVPLLRVLSGRNFEFAPFESKDIQARFGRDDWTTVSPDEIRFDGNTAYIAAY